MDQRAPWLMFPGWISRTGSRQNQGESHHQVRAVCSGYQGDLRKARQWKAGFSQARGPCTPMSGGFFMPKERMVLGAEDEWAQTKKSFGGPTATS